MTRNKTNARTSKLTNEPHSKYDIIVAVFVSLLLISNIAATKLIQIGVGTPVVIGPIPIWPLITDGGAVLFPLTYIFGDVLAEVYGWKRTRRAIWTGFGISILASITFLVVASAPAVDPDVGAAFSQVLGFVPRIVAASLLGYLAGQFVNAWVLVRIKDRTKEGTLWARLVGSTIVGELIDTIVFCTVAFAGEISNGELFNYILVGYVYKVTVEVAFLPLTYAIIGYLKQSEPGYQPASI